jgi:hypothetical protein
LAGSLFNSGPTIKLGGSNLLTNSGTLSPGGLGVVQTSALTGYYSQTATGTYAVDLGNAGTADLLNVSGAAALAGTVKVFFAGGTLAHSYTILSAASGFGGTTFDALTIPNSNFIAGLSYTTTDVLLNLIAATLGAGSGLNGNQQNVANAINGFFNGGGALPPNFGALFGLTGGNLANALSQLSGEAATGAQQGAFLLTNQFIGAMLDPFVYGSGPIGGGRALGFARESGTLPDDVARA